MLKFAGDRPKMFNSHLNFLVVNLEAPTFSLKEKWQKLI
jgi:hypothetical protein